MRIGFDAKRAFFNDTGLGNYSRTLIKALAEHYPQNSYYLYSPKEPKEQFMKPQDNVELHLPSDLTGKILPSVWRSMLLGDTLRNDKIDVYHGLSHELPANIGKSGAKSVVTVHDLINFRFPELYNAIDRAIYEKKLKAACNNADKVVAISEQTKADIIEFIGTPAEKIEVVYQSCAPAFFIQWTNAQLTTLRAKLYLPERYVLYVGSFAERKQVKELIKDYHQLQQDDLYLVLVGNGGAYQSELRQLVDELGLTGMVHFMNNVSNADLPAVYQAAELFVYPSMFEGFGLPIVEAMAGGTPVVTTQGSCFAEAGGADSLYVPSGDVDALSEAMQGVLGDYPKLQLIADKGRQYVQRFTPAQFAADSMSVYKSLL